MAASERGYLSGFGNEFASEAVPGALPRDQNAPQKPPLGLYIEELNGTAFTAPRGVSRSDWTYRIRPSATHKPFRPIGAGLIRSGPFNEVPPTPNQLRWKPIPIPSRADRLRRRHRDARRQRRSGAAVGRRGPHVRGQPVDARPLLLRRRRRAGDRAAARSAAACTPSSASSTWRRARSASIPRGVKFRVELPDGSARGYICENYGQHLRLPDLGPIGTSGLANARDFLAPVAAFEDRDGDFRVVAKFGGGLWEAEIDHSPLDIVAWRGNYVPYKYDLNRFQCINTVTFDHPDPSIYCVLASPSAVPGTANMEFGCFPPRWSVAEHTFRPPPFHRNVASEFLGLISGQYIGKADSFAPGSASLHNCMSGHGPDSEAYERGSSAELKPTFLENTMVFLFETQLPIRPTKFALETELLERDYYQHWQGLKKHFSAEPVR